MDTCLSHQHVLHRKFQPMSLSVLLTNMQKASQSKDTFQLDFSEKLNLFIFLGQFSYCFKKTAFAKSSQTLGRCNYSCLEIKGNSYSTVHF